MVIPTQGWGVIFGRRYPRLGGQFSTPIHIKFFLHLSKDEQRKRFLDRIDEPDKNWKFSQADIEERKYWGKYRKAFEECLSATSTADSPWYIVPADDKENARLIVSQIVLDTLGDLKMSYPKTGPEREQELLAIRKQLES
jgi:hypothetical protein